MSKKDRSASRGPGGRFKKGQTGNPKGRPKRRKNNKQAKTGSAFDVIVDKTLTVTQGGQPRDVTLEEALQHQTYKDALAGDRAARGKVLKMIAKREAYVSAKKRNQPPARTNNQLSRVEPRSESDPPNADEALQILSIARRDPKRDMTPEYGTHLLLEPWAVQAALKRRRGGQKLTSKDIAEINRCTHDASSLRWPRGTEA